MPPIQSIRLHYIGMAGTGEGYIVLAHIEEQNTSENIAIELCGKQKETSAMEQITENAPNSGMKYGDIEMAVLILG